MSLLHSEGSSLWMMTVCESTRSKEKYSKYSDISVITLEFELSVPVEWKISKFSEQETVYVTRDQQEEMERLLKKNNT